MAAPFVKICGITSAADAEVCARAGADRLGFVVEYPEDVPWNLSASEAGRLMRRVPRGVVRVAVVGGTAGTIVGIVDATGADAVQLHGDEDEDTVAAVAATGVPVVKALRADASRAAGDPGEWVAAARRFVTAGAAEILLDSRSTDRPAGTGVAFDRRVAATVVRELDRPVILAGGLSPGNVTDAVARVRPAGVDVISGVEGPGHRKDPALVAAFVAAAKSGG